MYELDIALEIIAQMEDIKSRELDDAVNEEDKKKIQEQIDILFLEEKALYKNDNYRASVIDKALRIYAPVLKKKSQVKEYEFS